MESNLESEDFVQLAAVYELLSFLWLQEVNLEILTALNSDEMRGAYENLGGVLPDEINDEVIEELAVDYCQLLIGPQGQVSPVQSVWENQALQSETSSSMRRYFQQLPGYEPPNSIPDHIGVQLHFLGELFQVAASDNQGELCQQIADEFYQKHLRWTAPFLARVKEQAETEFYAGLADLTSNFLNLEPHEL